MDYTKPVHTPENRSPLEPLANFARYLVACLAPLYLGSPQGGKIPGPLLSLVFGRMTDLQARFARLAAKILAGTYQPRRTTPRQTTAAAKPQSKTPQQRFGWLAELLPDAVAAPLRGHLRDLLQDRDMQALIAAAPAPMAKLFRPVCWALKFKPPEILKIHRRPAGTPPPAPTPYVRPPPLPPPIPGPANMLGLHPIQMLPMTPRPKTA
jgi:hypothetical protein